MPKARTLPRSRCASRSPQITDHSRFVRAPQILVREQIIVDGNFLAARTTFSGDFTGVFTYSPIGPVEPTGEHLEWELIGIFRYDGNGRLAEEWVQADYRSFLTKLGVTTTESAWRVEAVAILTTPEGVENRPGLAPN